MRLAIGSSMNSRQQLAKQIVQRCTLHGEFTLRSGQKSNIYFDKYLLESDPALLREITLQMKALLPSGADALAGLETGGIPIAVMLAQHTGLPSLFVRKKAKDYGTCKLAEGGELKGKRLIIVEDVVTSGGQVLISAKDLRALGAEIIGVVCVIDREQGGREALAKEGMELRPLFTRKELEAAK